METVNSLEQLQLLEKKVTQLIELVRDEKALNAQLVEEKNSLSARLDSLENSLLQETKGMEELNQERMLTKVAVDELISSIDRLVDEQQTSTAS